LGKSELVFEAADPEATHALLDHLRRSAAARWTSLLVGALLAAAIVFALLFRLPDTRVLVEAGGLCSAASRLGWALAGNGPAADVPAARTEIERHLNRLQAAVAEGHYSVPALADFRARLATLPAAAPPLTELQPLWASADAVVATLQNEVQGRHQRLELWLKTLTVLLALSLVVPIHGLWRQRQRMRASLHQFSDHLGQGSWQDAVQGLRDDRLGAPSAFDALASGVEGVLGESDRRWRALADLSADWYWETDSQHRVSWLSGSTPAVTVLGWAPEEMMGKRRDEIGFLEAPALGWAALHERLDRGEPFRDLEFRVHARRGGHALWIAISGRARHDSRGDFVGYEGVGRDITERKTAHERLVASEQRWSLMAGLASDWYWETDTEHRIRPLRPEVARRFPNLAETVVGRTRWEAHRGALTQEQWAEHEADLEARRPFKSLQFEAETDDGRFLWMSISGIPRFDGQGRFLGYHGVGRDITVRKQAERLLLRHNEALQRAVAERTRELQQLNVDLDAFSRQLAHELRTPIGHIEGLAHLIDSRAGERLSDDDRQLLQLQAQAAQNMRSTVDALLQLAHSTMQAMPMAPVDVSALAAQALAELPALERRAPVQWHIAPGLAATGSAAALRIVLSNLLGNAAKFTRHVEAPSVRLSGERAADGRLRIRIEDNGAGFDPAQAGRLFVPFNRLHGGEQFHGTGIGLSIVQRIVERHGGTVSARGEVGRGACFEFTLAMPT
jgi:PAS domain S-box-containing protein